MEYSWVSEISTPSGDEKNGLSSCSREGGRGEPRPSATRRTRGEMRETAVKELWSALDFSLKDDDKPIDRRRRDKGNGRVNKGRKTMVRGEDRRTPRAVGKSERRRRRDRMLRMLRDELGRLSLSRENQKVQATGMGIFREKKAKEVTARMRRRGDLRSGRKGRLTPCESSPSAESVHSRETHKTESVSRQASDGVSSTSTWRSGVSGNHKPGRTEYPHWGDGSSKILDMTFQKLVENYGFRTISAPRNDSEHAHGDGVRFISHKNKGRCVRHVDKTDRGSHGSALRQAQRKRTRKEIQDESLCTRSSSMSELSDVAKQGQTSLDISLSPSPTIGGDNSTPRRQTGMTIEHSAPRFIGSMPRLSARTKTRNNVDSTTFDVDKRGKGQANMQSFSTRKPRQRSRQREDSACTDEISGDTFTIQKHQDDHPSSAAFPHRLHRYGRNSSNRENKSRYSHQALSDDSQVHERVETRPDKWSVSPDWPKWSRYRERFRQMVDSIRKRSHRKPYLSSRKSVLGGKELAPHIPATSVTTRNSTAPDRTPQMASRMRNEGSAVTNSSTYRNGRLDPVSFDSNSSFSELRKEGFSFQQRKDRSLNANAKSSRARHQFSRHSSRLLLPRTNLKGLTNQLSSAPLHETHKDFNANFDEGEQTGSTRPDKNNNDISGVRQQRKYFLPSSAEDTGNDNKLTASYFIGEYLFELWNNQCLCDVRLEVGDHSFLAHKVVLAAFSDLFYPPNPHDVPAASFQLPCVDPLAVQKVLLYLYTSEMELTDDMLEYVLVAADSLGILDVVEMVHDILMKPSLDTLDLYMDIRGRNNMSTSLVDSPETYRLYFLDLIHTDYFLSLGISQVETILSDPNTIVNSEVDAFHAVAKWIIHDPNNRIMYAGRLLQHVNFECIAPGDLAKLVDEYNFLLDNKEANSLLMDIFRSHAASHDSLQQQNSSASNHWTPQTSTEPPIRQESSYDSVDSSCAACQPAVTTSTAAQRFDTADHQGAGNFRSRLGKWLRLGSRKTESPRDWLQGQRHSTDYRPSHFASTECATPQDVWTTPTSPYNLWNSSPCHSRGSLGRRRNFHDDTTISTPSKGSCPSTDTSPYTQDRCSRSRYVSSYPSCLRTCDQRNTSRSSSVEPMPSRYGPCSHRRYHHILDHNHRPQHHHTTDHNHSFHRHPTHSQWNNRHRRNGSAYEESDQRSSGCLSDSEHVCQTSFSSSSSRAPSKGKRVSFGPCQTGEQ